MVRINKELAEACAGLDLPVEEEMHGANVWGEVDNQGWRLFVWEDSKKSYGGWKGNEVDYLVLR